MKISPITNASNISIVKRLKNLFSNCKLKLKTLTKDVFEKQIACQGNDKNIKQRQEKIDVPVFVQAQRQRPPFWSADVFCGPPVYYTPRCIALTICFSAGRRPDGTPPHILE